MTDDHKGTDAYERVQIGTYSDGSPMVTNKRTVAMLSEASKRLGYDLTILQGSFHRGVGASAGTHDGSGVVDLAPFEADKKERALRNVGFAAWHREPIPGVWGAHVHAVAIGDHELSDPARAQVTDYMNGLNGLADHARDPHSYRPSPPVVFDYKQWLKEQEPDDPEPATSPNIDKAIKALRDARDNAKTPGRVSALTKLIRALRGLKAPTGDPDTKHH